MDLAIIQKIAQELNEMLPGGFVNKIHQPLPREIVLSIRLRGGGGRKLVLSADPKLGRIHLTDMKIPNPPRPPRFCAYLRAHFQGARLLEVCAAADDRVVTITGVRGPEGQRQELNLTLELLGRDSNILLVDRSTSLILDCLHHIPPKEAGTRVVVPGRLYTAPPLRIQTGRAAVPETLQQTGEAKPGIGTSPNGKKRLVLLATSPTDEGYPTMNEAAGAFFRPVMEAWLLEGLKRSLAAPLKARIRSLERRTEKILADERRLDALLSRQEEGELLKANLRRVRKGMDRIDVQDWSSGARRTIRLEPALDPVANMERIFRQAAKGKRGANFVRQRQQDTFEEKAALEDLLFFVEDAADVGDLERIAQDRPVKAGTQRPEPGAELPAGAGPQMFREVRSPSGRPVLVGKSGRGNDFVLRRKSRKGDLWFHVKGFAGAHVLLLQRTREPATEDDRAFAAALAVHFSKAKGAGKVEVMVADPADIRHPKGGLPGQVTVKIHKTMVSDGTIAGAVPSLTFD
jgi:predicted ribosome quality control (RQC) complex YloA/Tae2 family protein